MRRHAPHAQGSGQHRSSAQLTDNRNEPHRSAPKAKLVPAQRGTNVIGARWSSVADHPPPAKHRPESRSRDQAPQGDRITKTAEGHWAKHGPKNWVATPRQTAKESLAAWHLRPPTAARSVSPRPAVPANQANIPQTWVAHVCEPTAATFKRPLPSGPGQDVQYSTDAVATFCDEHAVHRRSPPTLGIPVACDQADVTRTEGINLELASQRVNGRPICMQWQLSGHQ